MLARFITTLVIAQMCAGLAFASDDEWSRFRGPNGTGVSGATNLPVEFDPEKGVAWKTALPPGHSSPVLARSRIYITAHTPTDAKNKADYLLFVIALDRKTGKEIWRREIPRAHKSRLEYLNGPASASPVTDGENVYAFFQDFGLIAFDADGREKWRTPLGPFNIFYGYGASPILVEDKVILSVDQDLGAYLLALDKNTGEVRWKIDRPEVISGYSTPTIYQPKQGPKQLIIPESFQLSAYSVDDGKRVWWVRGLACEMKSVVSYDNEYLYINGWGLPQNQPGQQIPTVPFAEGLARYDENKDGLIAKSELEKIDRTNGDKMGFMLKV
ncbi:MAG: PQQ-binding-like beta-propeller repeat protein, partial [Chloracidobacterium sp.]|nr:PQQ-binding-like beta-propeller repeat protein [Chloracidobacterium sp.]